MRILLLVLSCVAALFAVVLLADMKLGGTYIEVVAFGVFFGATIVGLGCVGIMARIDKLATPADTGRGLANELLTKWDSMAPEKRVAIARELIRKVDRSASDFLKTATESQIKERLSTLE